VDSYIRNKEGLFVTRDEFGDPFLLKEWYDGAECAPEKPEQARLAVRNLAGLHEVLSDVKEPEGGLLGTVQTALPELFEKRNRELRRVRGFLREKHRRGYFENTYINVFGEFYEKAERALALAKEWDTEGTLKKACAKHRVCHGSYNHHNLLLLSEQKMATVNFERAEFGVQIADFYLFFRKLMEKTNWNRALAANLLETYADGRAVERAEWNVFYLLLLYPEKFWKVTNTYYNGKKTWIPEKTVEKLETVREQEAAKQALLADVAERTAGLF